MPEGVSLLEPPPPPSPWPRRIAVAVAAVLVVGALLYWEFRFYKEEKQVERFMEALQAGDYQQAYQIWQPAPTYSYQDFLEDWGEFTARGRVRSYQILGVQAPPRSSGVIVSVRINGLDPPERIWVERRDLSLSFPP